MPAAAAQFVLVSRRHAPQRRVLYERPMARVGTGGVCHPDSSSFQRPSTSALPSAWRSKASREDLATLGFLDRSFGHREHAHRGTRLHTGAPSGRGRGAPGCARLLARILEWRKAEGLERLRHRLAATGPACHAAVTANHPLTPAACGLIVGDLLGTGHADDLSPRPAVSSRLTRMPRFEKEFIEVAPTRITWRLQAPRRSPY